jgi:uncharacterized membrane protein
MARAIARGGGDVKEFLAFVTEYAVLLINFVALFVILVGTVEAFGHAMAAALSPKHLIHERAIWLRYAHWLVAGLTFQLAADIIETSIAPSWADIGRIAAVAVIRTFLNFFLERDLAEVSARRPAPA